MTAGVKSIFGERFAMRPSTLTMPWGTVYVCLEMVLMHSETSWRFGGDGRWCAVEDSYENALAKVCTQIKAQMGE